MFYNNKTTLYLLPFGGISKLRILCLAPEDSLPVPYLGPLESSIKGLRRGEVPILHPNG